MKIISSLVTGFFIAVAFILINPNISAFDWQWWVAFIIIYVAKEIETYFCSKLDASR